MSTNYSTNCQYNIQQNPSGPSRVDPREQTDRQKDRQDKAKSRSSKPVLQVPLEKKYLWTWAFSRPLVKRWGKTSKLCWVRQKQLLSITHNLQAN